MQTLSSLSSRLWIIGSECSILGLILLLIVAILGGQYVLFAAFAASLCLAALTHFWHGAQIIRDPSVLTEPDFDYKREDQRSQRSRLLQAFFLQLPVVAVLLVGQVILFDVISGDGGLDFGFLFLALAGGALGGYGVSSLFLGARFRSWEKSNHRLILETSSSFGIQSAGSTKATHRGVFLDRASAQGGQ